jgi:hypothetical protein
MKAVAMGTILACLCSAGNAQAVSALFARGYTVVPAPQDVVLESKDFAFGQSWQLQLQKTYHLTMSPSNCCAMTLRQDSM